MIVHAFTTRKYIDEVSLPAIERGLEAGGKKRADLELSCPMFVVTGDDARSWEAARTAVCRQIAFYGSTPAYRPVLEIHGWGDLQPDLNAMSKRGEWSEMGALITDDILEEFAVVARPDEIAGQMKKRYGDVIDRVLATFSGDLRGEAMETLRS